MYVQQNHRIFNKYLKPNPILQIKYKMFLKQFSQGICLTGAVLTSFATLGYMVNDIHKMEKKQLRKGYEEQIKQLNNEINRLKLKY